MNSVSALVATIVLRHTLARACPATVTRSGEEGQRANCFITKVDIGEEVPMVVLAIANEELTGLGWGGSKYSEERRVKLRDQRFSAFEITHFYGLANVRYTGLLDFIVGRITALPYAKINLARAIDRVDQFFFNKKKLVTKRRMDLLKFLVERKLNGEFSSMGLMIDLYSMRWLEHPDGEAAETQLEFYLEAMTTTGELQRSGHGYQVTGKALFVIEEYEEQERKHFDNVKLGRRMFWLTVIIAGLTAVQAGLVKLPPLLDLSVPAVSQ